VCVAVCLLLIMQIRAYYTLHSVDYPSRRLATTHKFSPRISIAMTRPHSGLRHEPLVLHNVHKIIGALQMLEYDDSISNDI